ncbi:hypothetical protein EMPS_11158 [Entomortierella parvispora]|uniref:Uncharacterized protein n=1 Tax=Entomortierella parvispora TaxID=205924 RepID=A0A9P3HL51_9FUNG|nr:hypothetical protein EMPS_11158 [Entomortierella parvispora]
MDTRPLNRSETHKEVEDREYLAQLLRTQTLLAAQANLNPANARRMKERSTSPPGRLYIPRTEYVPSRLPPLPSIPSPYSTSSTVSLEAQRGYEEASSAMRPASTTLTAAMATTSAEAVLDDETFKLEPPSLLIVHPPSPYSPTSTSSVPFLPYFEQQQEQPPSPEARSVSPFVATYLRQQEDQSREEAHPLRTQGSASELKAMAQGSGPQQQPSHQDRRSRSSPLSSPTTPTSTRARSPQSPMLHNNSASTTATSSATPAAIWTEHAARQERLERQTRQEQMLKRSSLLQPVHRTSLASANSSHGRHRSMPSPSSVLPLLGTEHQPSQHQPQPSIKPLDRAWSQKWTFSLQQQQWEDLQRQQHHRSLPPTLSSRSKRISFATRVFGQGGSRDNAAGASGGEQRQLPALFDPQRQDQLQRPALATTRNSFLDASVRGRRDTMLSDSWTLNGSESTLTELWPTRDSQGGDSNDAKDVNKDTKKKSGNLNPSGPIPLGLMALLICIFMFTYNVVLGIFVYQASGYHPFLASPSISLPATLFTLFFLVSAAVALFGLLVWALTSLRATRTSPLTSILFRIFHFLFLLVSLLTSASMLYWLKLNKDQTGQWDHMRLPPFSEEDDVGTSNPSQAQPSPLLSFQSLLKPAGPLFPSDEWLVNPWIWLSVFIVVLVAQMYSWVCLVAYVRQVAMRARCEKKVQDRDPRFEYEVKRRV